MSLGQAACCEPLSVALHAVQQAGSLDRASGCSSPASWPIGALVVAAARHAGALESVATTDDAALKKAARWARRARSRLAGAGLAAEEFTADKGYFDVAIASARGAGW